MKTKQKHSFWKGLLIYICVMLALICVGFFLFWNFMSAFEASQTDGVVNQYLKHDIQTSLRSAVANYAAAEEETTGAFQTEEDISAALTETLSNGTLSCRKAIGTYTSEQPVYTVRLDKTEIGTLRLAPGSHRLLSFGFDTWEVSDTAFDFSKLGKNVTVTAPKDLVLTLNGTELTDKYITGTGLYPDLEPYADSLPTDSGSTVTYSVGTLFTEPEVSVVSNGSRCTIENENGAVSVVNQCPAGLETQLTEYSKNFVQTYLAFTSNASGNSGAVQAYMIPGSPLSQRITASLDGMSWVHGVTATVEDLSVSNFRYYGSAAICDARYTLISGGNATENNMHVVLTETDSGWRVADIGMF